jgi:benzoyl-CoA reductase subunit B
LAEKRYPTEPLKCWNKAKELRRKYYEDYLKAKEKGGIRVSGSAASLWAPVAGLGEDVYLLTGEPYAATVTFFEDFSLKCLEAVERAGFARDLCGYMRDYWGSIILDKYILADGTIVDGWPKTDLFYTGHTCCSHAKWYQEANELEGGGIPIHPVDLPAHPLTCEIDEKRLDYVVEQLLDLTEWLEKVTGRKYNDELLFKAIQNDYLRSKLWGEICLYQKNIPAPLEEKSMFSFYVFTQLCPYKQEYVDFFGELRDEVKDRVERGIAAVANERFRIITDSQPPWAFLKVWRYLEREYGVVSIGSLYSFGLQDEWEIDERGNLVPVKIPEEKMTNREEALRTYAEFKLKNLVICGWFSAHVKSEMMKKIIKQWKVDAALIHINKGCEATAIGQMENRLALAEEDIPVLTFEGNMGDPREFDMARTVSRIDAFLEGAGVKKLT